MIFSPSRARAMVSKDEWAVRREFDGNIKLVSGRVSECCLLILTFPCVYDPLVSRVAVAAAAATNI